MCNVTGGNNIKAGKGLEKNGRKRRSGFLYRQLGQSPVMRTHLGRRRRQQGAQPTDPQSLTAEDRNRNDPAHLGLSRSPGHSGRLAKAPTTNPAAWAGRSLPPSPCQCASEHNWVMVHVPSSHPLPPREVGCLLEETVSSRFWNESWLPPLAFM